MSRNAKAFAKGIGMAVIAALIVEYIGGKLRARKKKADAV